MRRLWLYFPNKWVELKLERDWFEIIFLNDEYFLRILPYGNARVGHCFYIVGKNEIARVIPPYDISGIIVDSYGVTISSWTIADSKLLFSTREGPGCFKNSCIAKIIKISDRSYQISVDMIIDLYVGQGSYTATIRNIDDPDKIEFIFITTDRSSRMFKFKVINGPERFKVLYNDSNTERIINVPVWHINLSVVENYAAFFGIYLKSNDTIAICCCSQFFRSQITIPLDKLIMEREINIDEYKLREKDQIEFENREEYKISLFEGIKKSHFSHTNIFIGSKPESIWVADDPRLKIEQ